MPYENEHAARLRDPDGFERIVQLWSKAGVRALGGPLKSKPDGPTVEQAIRFDAKKFTVAEAKKWLSDHDYKPILFEPAKDKKTVEIEMERRVMCSDLCEMRIVEEEGQRPKIVGYAAVFDSPTSLRFSKVYGFTEKVKRGAFANVLARKADVLGLVNHDPNQRIGRTTAGTLILLEDDKGLRMEATPPDTQVGRDTVEDVRNGNLDGMSFQFRISPGGDKWERGRQGEPELRTLIEIDELYDVGPATFPAYPDTTAAVRSLDAWRKEQAEQEIEQSANQCEAMRMRLRLAETE